MPFRIARVRQAFHPASLKRQRVVDAAGQSTRAALAHNTESQGVRQQAFAAQNRVVAFGAPFVCISKALMPRELTLGQNRAPGSLHERIAQVVCTNQSASPCNAPCHRLCRGPCAVFLTARAFLQWCGRTDE